MHFLYSFQLIWIFWDFADVLTCVVFKAFVMVYLVGSKNSIYCQVLRTSQKGMNIFSVSVSVSFCMFVSLQYITFDCIPPRYYSNVRKGQLISKGLLGILNSSKIWTKKFDLTTMNLRLLVFVRFLEEFEGTKKTFRN